jgi:hypothetical protein
MDQIEFLNEETWKSRQEWFEKTLESGQHPLASYLVSDHATALFIDLQSCYCVGAFIAVIFLSISIMDAHFRDTGYGDGVIGTAQLLRANFTGDDIDWLRKLRNSYVHINVDNPALKIDDHYFKRTEMEENARKAITMVIHAFFQDPGT